MRRLSFLRRPSAQTWARVAALGLIALAVLVTAWSLRHPTSRALALPLGTPTAIGPIADPLVGQLYRCQARAADPACLAAWAENRRRFLAPDARPEEKLPPSSPAANRAAGQGAGARP